MPENMNWIKFDKKNIKNIIKDLVVINYQLIQQSELLICLLYTYKKIKWLSFLDYFDYDKFKAIEILKKNIILSLIHTNIMNLFLRDFIKLYSKSLK